MYVKKGKGAYKTFSPRLTGRGPKTPRPVSRFPRRFFHFKEKGWQILRILFFLGSLLIGGWIFKSVSLWDKIQDQMVSLMARHGLVIDDIMIEGRLYADVEDVKNAIGLDRGDPIFLYSPHLIKQRLESLSWVHSAIVQRIVPNILYVRLMERRPIAIWQNKGKHFLIDKEGKIIDSDKIGLFKNLPLLVGVGAPEGSEKLLQEIKDYPLIGENLKAAVCVGSRRWDLILKNGIKIMLPEETSREALQKLIELHEKHQILKRDVKSIDLRVSQKLAFSLSESLATGLRSRGKAHVKRI